MRTLILRYIHKYMMQGVQEKFCFGPRILQSLPRQFWAAIDCTENDQV